MAKAAKPVKKAIKKKPIERATPEEKRRRDWERCDAIISSVFCELMLKRQKLPTYVEIARQTKLSVRTVERHLQAGDYQDIIKRFRAGNERVLTNLFKQAISTDNHNIIKLWFEVVNEMSTKQDVQVSMKDAPLTPDAVGRILATLEKK